MAPFLEVIVPDALWLREYLCDWAAPDIFLRMAFRALGMWNRPTPAPEYRFAWGDKARVREGMERILAWDFERVILSHGDIITRDARQIVAQAWQKILC
jgi:hypothetical protein